MSSNRWSPLRAAQERARAAGHHTFAISLPCPRGHLGPRYASNGNCVQCASRSTKSTKPEAERQLKLTSKKSHITQVTLDEETAANVTKAKRYLSEVVGRPVSTSLVHRAAIRTLALYLRNTTKPAEAESLVY
jgi:hypothetical protein